MVIINFMEVGNKFNWKFNEMVRVMKLFNLLFDYERNNPLNIIELL